MARRFDADSGSETVSPAPQPTHLEIPMESALSPREIQARIRAGDSVEDVARIAGMTLEWVDRFASPILAEREYVAQQAQKHQVRRGGETIAHRNLGQVVIDRLASRRVSTKDLSWDAYRMEGRRWLVKLDYESGKSHREARFVYDANGRFSVADNDDARWLLGLHSASHGPQPGRRRREEESEPTVDLNDDIALVRVVQPRVDELPDPEDTAPLAYAEFDDAYAEAELAEVDGIYDILPSQQTDMDVLYEMLSGFDEDSVQIYTGLLRDDERLVPPTRLRPPTQLPVDPEPPARPKPASVRPASVRPASAKPASAKPPVAKTPSSKPTRIKPELTTAVPTAPEPELPVDQPPLVDNQGEPGADDKPRPRRKRAQVPSWDEIMFGSPKKRS
jgi:hypothetical protein